MTVTVAFRNIEELRDLSKYFHAMPEKSAKNLKMAMNKVGGGTGLTMFKKEMNAQVNFPTGYLNQENRFSLDKHASENDLSIVVGGRDRPTSLARFVTNAKPKSIAVKVNATGGGRKLRRAFLVNLKNSNQGLAVRVDKGQNAMRNSRSARLLTRNDSVFLLYAPSVDQIFREVSGDYSPEFAQMIEVEFLRLFERSLNE